MFLLLLIPLFPFILELLPLTAKSELEKAEDEVCEESRGNQTTLATVKKLQEGSAATRQDILSLQKSKARTEDTLKVLSQPLDGIGRYQLQRKLE